MFLHWRFAPDELRRLVPKGLEVDTYGGRAWVGVTPFAIPATRLEIGLPLAPACEELNVRTYVRRGDTSGIFFLSLDASSRLAVWGARLAYRLPYHRAAMALQERDGARHFRSVRSRSAAPPARFEMRWRRGERLPEAEPGSLDFFLVERYRLFTASAGKLFQARISHRPWPLCRIEVDVLESTMVESHGLEPPGVPPLVHGQAEPFSVDIWPLEPVPDSG